MSPHEHDLAIVAHLERLVAGAKKRTQGRWEGFQRNEEIGTNYFRITFTDRNSDSLYGYCGESNAAYIASCSENAEAGWLSTIAAIKALNKIHESSDLLDDSAWDALAEIRQLWPIEKLNEQP